MSLPTAVIPTYLAGKNGSVLVGTVVLDHMSFSVNEDTDKWDATNGNTGGFRWSEAGSVGASFQFEVVYRKGGTTPFIGKGQVYPFKLNLEQTGASTFSGWAGNALVTSISSTSNVKGETKYTGSAEFQGVFDSPEYPTALADFAATPKTGRFAPPA